MPHAYSIRFNKNGRSGLLATSWFGTFTILFSAIGYVAHHENIER